MAAVIPQEHFRITRGTPKMYARQTSPSKTMECWFCSDCETRLYHVPGGAAYANRNIKPGTLDGTSWLMPTIHFWTRSAQKWVHIPDGARRATTLSPRLYLGPRRNPKAHLLQFKLGHYSRLAPLDYFVKVVILVSVGMDMVSIIALSPGMPLASAEPPQQSWLTSAVLQDYTIVRGCERSTFDV